MRKLKLGVEAWLVHGHAAPNYSTLCLMKQQTFIISHSVWGPGTQEHFSWVVAARGSRGAVIFSEVPPGLEDPLPSPLLRLLAGASPQGVCGASWLPQVRVREKEGQRKGGCRKVFYNPTSAVTHHHSCLIQLSHRPTPVVQGGHHPRVWRRRWRGPLGHPGGGLPHTTSSPSSSSLSLRPLG